MTSGDTTPSTQRFTDYLWVNVRSSVLVSWVLIVAVSIVVYSGILVVLKGRQLRSTLKIAAETVNESLQAGDWSLALGHLRSMEKSGHAFEIALKSKTPGVELSGPFGIKPFGVGELCAEEGVGGRATLSGCVRVFDLTEVYTLGFFLIFSGVVFLVAMRFFQAKMLLFIRKVSDDLGQITRDDARKSDAPSGVRIVEIDAIRARITDLLTAIEKASAAEALAQLSVQVSHDILSPLAALEVAAGDVSQLPETKRVLIRNAVGRIRDIADNLLDKNRVQSLGVESPNKSPSSQLLSNLIESLVTEKRLQFRSRTEIDIEALIDAASYRISAQVQPVEFTRLLSNLINNAVEAIEASQGSVRVGLFARDGRAIVSVKDDGKGIPPEILRKLGQRGETYGKSGGSGLGVFHARATAESWGGSLEIASEVGKGTTVTLNLPLQPAPEERAARQWDAILIDDDPLVRETWQVAADLARMKLRVFASAQDFYVAAGGLGRDTPVYIDATLGESSRGEAESRTIHDMGFSEVYLATGQKAEEFTAYVYLRGVVGKSPPWRVD